MENKKKTTIKTSIVISAMLLVLVPLIILGFYSISANYQAALRNVESNLEDCARQASERIRWEIKAYQNVSIETGGKHEFTTEGYATDEQKQALLDSIAKGYGFERGNFINRDGIGLDGSDYNDREYFRQAMQGKPFVSDPLVSKITGKITIIISAPVWENGIYGGNAIGCVYFVPNEEFLNAIVRDINPSENGDAYVINKNGRRIADDDVSLVDEGLNIIELASNDSDYKEMAAIHKKMIAGESGSVQLQFMGASTIVGYAPIAEMDGWSLGVEAPAKDFISDTYKTMIFTLVLLLVGGTGAFAGASHMGKRIGSPVAACAERLNKLAKGDLKSPAVKVNTRDETRVLADASEALVADMNEIIGDIGYMLSSMAAGDFAVRPKCSQEVYKGDFRVLYESVNEINRRLNSTLSQINLSADQVSNGSDQVSGGAQSLSQGAEQQASSVEELAASIKTIENKVIETTRDCEDGRNLVVETVEYIEKASRQMNALTTAMQDISGAAGEIGKIIKTIEDIAFQTNILALNAAVEAARAGEAGKGFAVVADEVRNLASKSAEASHDTAKYIERTVTAVEKGTAITAETSAAVAQVEERSANVKSIVEHIAVASEEQADMVRQITGGIEQISSTVQTTSATAEESAAASEELSGQAQSLKNLVAAFKLRR